MCTAVNVQTPHGDIYFGRTMDFSYPLDPELYVIPKGYKWNNLWNTHRIENQYRIMGIGQDISPVILADGVNEMGFAAAVLYFPGYARYDAAGSGNSPELPVAALELVNFLLGQCACVDQAASILRIIRIVGVEDPVTESIAPLHWIIADKRGACMVVEKTAEGLHLIPNPLGVLSNSPDFQWHMTNLNNYMNIAPSQQSEKEWGPVNLTPFGQGAGTFGLPGDYTPPSRFVRTAYLKNHTVIPETKEGAVNACFHIMESVSIPKGAVMTDRCAPDYTQYTAFMDLCAGEYYFKTYENSQVVSARLPSGQWAGIKSLGKLIRPAQLEEWNT
ncbi:linear amide C-N hydrolase [Diplocloster modestus]|uniref:Choloylglycine hydrolase family protein n=1 Tax=Diplocloster modestus TaxID=2850322 RepID=A0ABS6K1C2_9FIRM|nr:choloylglycine hydrolase family protein [Diplocloster modestus]MBU9724518.1 choloylglycine hydrolase family protein [Diplocloster modestus]